MNLISTNNGTDLILPVTSYSIMLLGNWSKYGLDWKFLLVSNRLYFLLPVTSFYKYYISAMRYCECCYLLYMNVVQYSTAMELESHMFCISGSLRGLDYLIYYIRKYENDSLNNKHTNRRGAQLLLPFTREWIRTAGISLNSSCTATFRES